MPNHLAAIGLSDAARQYGPGLGYPPAETFVLASLGVAGCALVVYGYFAFKFLWWPVPRKRSRKAGRSDDHGPDSRRTSRGVTGHAAVNPAEARPAEVEDERSDQRRRRASFRRRDRRCRTL